jgi:hypothetical protein
MNKAILVTIALMSLIGMMSALSIYDVQYTNNPGVDNSYPSPYVGREVLLDGIVSSPDYQNSGYFISEPLSGAWRGILVLDKRNNPAPGSKIRIRGKVHESFGMTCIHNVDYFAVLDANAGLPLPMILTTGQLSRADEAEAYEGVYARVLNASTASAKSRKGRFSVTDGSGQCSIVTGSFSTSKAISPVTGTQFNSIVGIVVFSFSEFSLNPVTGSDVQIQTPKSTQNRSWGKIKSIYK